LERLRTKIFQGGLVMYTKILAPLDGSWFSECCLEHVKTVAIGCQVPEVVLFMVVEPIKPIAYTETSRDWVAEKEKHNQAEAEKYLSKLAENLRGEGVAVQAAVAHGNPAEEILDYAKKNQVGLIIMSTHGRSGILRWAFGSVTDRVLHHSAVPVLITPPPGRIKGESPHQ